MQQVWREKFNPDRGRPVQQSNVDLAVLDSSGRVVHWFDGFAYQDFGRRESLAEYTARELRKAASQLRLSELTARENPLNLPDLDGSRGIRVFVRLLDERMTAYQVPVVEVVPLEQDDWTQLAWPSENRSVNAASLIKWLSQVYPPGVMERTNPRTKLAYKIKTVEGKLLLSAAGADATQRFATLTGTVKLTDEGEDEFSYEGKLNVVLTYQPDEADVVSLRGVFEGTYPRYDRMHDRSFRIPLQAVFESRPQ